MSTGMQTVTARDLVDEAKKRIVFLSMCLVGLSYLMSLTSSSVLINFPAALLLLILLRYFTLDYDMKRKAASYTKNPSTANVFAVKKPSVDPKSISGKSDWRRKVNSPVVEDAIDQFTKHIVSEWVTDLWDIIKLFCTHLELFRACQIKIIKQESLAIGQRDIELKSVLYAENKLHPALFSSEAEYKVLQHLMDGFISFTFRPEGLQCSLFHYIVREILAYAVIRPVVNLANPRAQGVELTSLKKENYDSTPDNPTIKDPLLSIDTKVDTRKQNDTAEWGGGKSVIISRRKTEALAPENFENMWAKGRNYKTKEDMVQKSSFNKSMNLVNQSKTLTSQEVKCGPTKGDKSILFIYDEDDDDDDEDQSRTTRDMQDVLSSSKGYSKSVDSSDESDKESLARSNSGTSANIVKSGSKTFALYPISVTDVNNRLMQLPTISGSIEVWDFLSVDSQV
ncbi:hypothetical protein L2E82_27170 [Cichorium intybus]|uniref:Uncharacterized protein n=1 Tax=Cichorium intybus TaxID=13427 RepID=A0ACB9CSC3_CICIN|nr:hypothetical protein L2E82_27170 [Cichorium intybus]